jgi:hypothetical protein
MTGKVVKKLRNHTIIVGKQSIIGSRIHFKKQKGLGKLRGGDEKRPRLLY